MDNTTFKTISVFNHKGGVSKTTTTYNIGWKLATKGFKVLLVDGDPQCNLTGLILKDNFEDYYTTGSSKLFNIKDAVRPAF
ncbi:ParA family protein [Robertmurraya siralis]|uniref:ParA family protein n=2 Tax=Robertmurraya TaxID=2837507 RepID=UPI001B85F6F7|nr:ParA family protein [Robertmurraya siralis]